MVTVFLISGIHIGLLIYYYVYYKDGDKTKAMKSMKYICNDFQIKQKENLCNFLNVIVEDLDVTLRDVVLEKKYDTTKNSTII